jgi:hypothetical protein
VAVAGVPVGAAVQRPRQADLAFAGRQDHRADPPERACRCRARRPRHAGAGRRPAGGRALEPDPKKAKEIEIKLKRRLRKHAAIPKFKKLSERLDALKDRFEAGQINSVEFLKQLLQIAKETLQAEKETPPEEDEDRGKAALTELFNEVKTPRRRSWSSGWWRTSTRSCAWCASPAGRHAGRRARGQEGAAKGALQVQAACG